MKDFPCEKEIFKSTTLSFSLNSRLFQKRKKIKFSCSGLMSPVIKKYEKKKIINSDNSTFFFNRIIILIIIILKIILIATAGRYV